MWISSYKLERNVLPPDWVISRVRNKFSKLRSTVSSRLGDDFKVTMDFSMHSEACYLIITDRQTQTQFKISFRSHDNFGAHPYDKEVLLYKFKTWNDCVDYFMSEVLNEIISHYKNNLIHIGDV